MNFNKLLIFHIYHFGSSKNIELDKTKLLYLPLKGVETFFERSCEKRLVAIIVLQVIILPHPEFKPTIQPLTKR